MKYSIIPALLISIIFSCNPKEKEKPTRQEKKEPVKEVIVNKSASLVSIDSAYNKGYTDGYKQCLQDKIAEHQPYEFYQLDSIEISLFNSFNKIDSICVNHDWNNYYSHDGVISFNKSLNIWQIDSSNNYKLQINNEKNIEQEIPRSFKRGAYFNVKDRVRKDNHEIVLMGLSSEGCYSWSAVFDTMNNKVYNSLSALNKSIDFDSKSIHLGQKYGFSVIDKNNDYKSNYILLPIYDPNSSIKIISNTVFSAINFIGIQKVEMDSKSVDFWSYKDLISLFPDIKQKMVYGGFPLFSNICQVDSQIVIGCRVVQDYWMGYTRNSGSLLFLYSLKNNRWNAVYLDKLESVGVIAINNNKLWFGGHQIEQSEGDPSTLHGGVGYYNFASNEIVYIDSIPKRKLVLSFSFNNEDTFVEICNYKEKYKYKISEDNNATLVDSTYYENYKDYKKMISNKLFSLMKEDSIKFSKQLIDLKVQPKIISKDSILVERTEKYKKL